MRDPRLDKLADNIVRHSVKVQPGDVAMIDHSGAETLELSRAVSEAVVRAKGVPVVVATDAAQVASFVANASEEQVRALGENQMAQMQGMSVYIAIRGDANIFELNRAPEEKMNQWVKLARRPVTTWRVENTRWVVMRYPNPSMAQLAGKSTQDFEDYYFDACLVDYARMDEAQQPLVKLMAETDKVRIQSDNGTDLTFSVKGIPAVGCAGEYNIPDGECFTAPVRESVNGVVQYNTRTAYLGTPFQNIRLRFENGRAVEASDNLNTARLNEILDSDEGARYIGEFALGFHPTIEHPMCDILFDEKIRGSFHMALGACYKEEAPNGNESGVHWDMVQIQRPDYGGGKIWFDGVLVREDGVFVLDELKGLNPENLVG